MSKLARPLELLRFWYAQRVKGFAVPDMPSFDPASIAWFEDRLGRAKRYLEFGSGGSTLLASRLGIPTITVENDRWFAHAVERKLPSHAGNAMLVVNLGLTSEWGRPTFRRQTLTRLSRWRRYIETPFEYIARAKLDFPDFVLIDGRFRRACALKTAQTAAEAGKPVTICFDDYRSRPHYHDVEEMLGKPAMNGRMAVFEVAPSVSIPPQAIDAAARDLE